MIKYEVSEVKSLSRVRLFVTPGTVAYYAPPSMVVSRQEYWNGLPFPSPQEALRLLKIYLEVNPILTCDKKAMSPEGSIKTMGLFSPLRLLGQDTEDVPVGGDELLDKKGCHADSEAQTPRQA